MTPPDLVSAYYAAFNRADWPAMLAMLTDDVAHDVNQGEREVGKAAFAAFLGRMDTAYREQLRDVVVMAGPPGVDVARVAAEFVVEGQYLQADPGFPPARGQAYRLPVGAFFEVRGGRIARVTTYYNLADWLRQVAVITLERLRGAAIAPHVDALAALRTSVFRAYPYLYDGTAAAEARYLAGYAASPAAVVVAAFDGATMVGASTALPARAHGEEVAAALAAGGLDPDAIYYFGESVLDARYRGRGLGHAFFDHREAVARQLGFREAAFCAVDRAAEDPRRPPGYTPLDAFWTRRGYVRQAGVVATMAWREVDAPPGAPEPPHTLTFWRRSLA